MINVQNKNSSYFVEWIPNNVKALVCDIHEQMRRWFQPLLETLLQSKKCSGGSVSNSLCCEEGFLALGETNDRRAEESRGKQRKAIPGCRRENQRDAVVAAATDAVGAAAIETQRQLGERELPNNQTHPSRLPHDKTSPVTPEIKRLVPTRPNNQTHPSPPPHDETSPATLEIKRLVPTGPNNQTHPPLPPHDETSPVTPEIKRLVPTGPNNQTHPSPHSHDSKDNLASRYFKIKRRFPDGPNNKTSPPTPGSPFNP
ncbi:hypothetical protein LOK49_LG05G02798 [Camellia lanceoleosa]|uniref:Uncharacterized protein n=1 Tax=Camellia lanceoleosa TaxID=1840588 RepID=A0ACC0HNX8_9ERIC|nr:hypothetical protein LOK49_LG05G02798 [Camellia lanceoleosa]